MPKVKMLKLNKAQGIALLAMGALVILGGVVIGFPSPTYDISPIGLVLEQDTRNGGFVYGRIRNLGELLREGSEIEDAVFKRKKDSKEKDLWKKMLGEAVLFAPFKAEGYRVVCAIEIQNSSSQYANDDIPTLLRRSFGNIPGIKIGDPIPIDDMTAYSVSYDGQSFLAGYWRGLIVLSDSIPGIKTAIHNLKSEQEKFTLISPSQPSISPPSLSLYISDQEGEYFRSDFVVQDKKIRGVLNSSLLSVEGRDIFPDKAMDEADRLPGGGKAYAIYSGKFDFHRAWEAIGPKARDEVEVFLRTVLPDRYKEDPLGIVKRGLGDRITLVLGGKAWSPLGEIPGAYAFFRGGSLKDAEVLAASIMGAVRVFGDVPVVSGSIPGWDYVFTVPVYVPVVLAGGHTREGDARILVGVLDPRYLQEEVFVSQAMKTWLNSKEGADVGYIELGAMGTKIRDIIRVIRQNPTIGTELDFNRAEAMAAICETVESVAIKNTNRGNIFMEVVFEAD